MNIAQLEEWVGRTETQADQVTAVPVAALAATLDRDDLPPQPGDPLPPLWHWLYFLPVHRQSELGPDGHPKRGGFLPPVPLPRRMWAASRFTFHYPLSIGEKITRTSRISSVESKEGRTGPLVFVTVHHEIRNDVGVALDEDHTIVYRDHPNPADPAPASRPAPTDPAWQRTVQADDVLLFRYSALTFNGHRIHYDRRYVTEVEGYAGLVVHGPLIATLLMDLLRRSVPQARVTGFRFQAVSPLFDTAPFSVCGKPDESGRHIHLWARNATGGLAMDATAKWHRPHPPRLCHNRPFTLRGKPMPQDNTEIVKALYQAFGRGDIPAVLEILDSGIQWNEAENFLYSDRNPYVGPQAVLEGVFGRIAADWDGFSATANELVASGDTVVAFGRYGGTYRNTGVSVHAQFVHVFKLRNGKIVSFQQYTDTAQFQEAAGRGRSARV